MATRQGRPVTGQLVRGEDGIWREVAPKVHRWHGEVLDADERLRRGRAGETLQAIGCCLLRGRQLSRPHLSSFYRAICKVLNGAGIRVRDAGFTRVSHGRDPLGVATLPAAIEALL